LYLRRRTASASLNLRSPMTKDRTRAFFARYSKVFFDFQASTHRRKSGILNLLYKKYQSKQFLKINNLRPQRYIRLD
jgi:hypothetical protein